LEPPICIKADSPERRAIHRVASGHLVDKTDNLSIQFYTMKQNIELQQFAKLVSQVRHYQKQYFRYRTPDDLREAKRLEKLIDSEIERFTGTGETLTGPEHPKLF
jgi:hypothetical protein